MLTSRVHSSSSSSSLSTYMIYCSIGTQTMFEQKKKKARFSFHPHPHFMATHSTSITSNLCGKFFLLYHSSSSSSSHKRTNGNSIRISIAHFLAISITCRVNITGRSGMRRMEAQCKEVPSRISK